MTEHALNIDGISKRFGDVQALDDVSFTVPRRSIFGLLGPNGAGKTTLFSLAANFLHPDSGRVEVLDIDVRQISRLQGRLSILPQDALFQRNVPLIDQLTFFLLLIGRSREEAEAEVKKTMELVGLGEYTAHRVHTLSHGMIKRLGIAQAFLGEPDVILLDEPTSGLDPQSARQIRGLIRELNKSHATVVISSHNLAEVQELCDQVAILDRGKLVAAGSVDEMTRASRELDLVLSRALAEEEKATLQAIDGVVSLEARGETRYTVRMNLEPTNGDAYPVVAPLLRAVLDLGITPRLVREGRSLEEFFLRVTGRGEEKPGAP